MAGAEHNSQEIYEDQQFLKAFTELKTLESKGAGIRADQGAVYNRLKDIGWTKKDFEFAKWLQDKDVGEVLADLKRKERIARLMGHPLGRQLSLLDSDPATEEERAFQEGYSAGKLRKDNKNPYDTGSDKGQAWQRGFNDGAAFINQELKDAVEREGA
jgi:ribosome modulation factor